MRNHTIHVNIEFGAKGAAWEAVDAALRLMSKNKIDNELNSSHSESIRMINSANDHEAWFYSHGPDATRAFIEGMREIEEVQNEYV
jgi:hypothetical protein